jgi:hypothetical protein
MPQPVGGAFHVERTDLTFCDPVSVPASPVLGQFIKEMDELIRMYTNWYRGPETHIFYSHFTLTSVAALSLRMKVREDEFSWTI